VATTDEIPLQGAEARLTNLGDSVEPISEADRAFVAFALALLEAEGLIVIEDPAV